MSNVTTNITSSLSMTPSTPAHPIEMMQIWKARVYQRRQLATATKAQLTDMGITTSQAMEEAAKPFWKA